MSTIATQQASLAGAAITYAAASGGGDTFVNNGAQTLHVKNGSGGSLTVTINSIKPCDQGFDHDAVVAVAAGATEIIGPFPVGRFGRAPAITYSAVTSLTVAVVGQ